MDVQLVLLGCLIFFLIFYIQWAFHTAEVTQKRYETEFLSQNRELIEQYQAKTLPFIPLRIEHRHPENLSDLCMQYPKLQWGPLKSANKILVKEFVPRVEVQFINFQKIDEESRPSEPLRIELIRCSENFAFITAGTGNYSYYLVRDTMDSNIPDADVRFFINGKFEYKEQIPLANAEPMEPTQISGRNRPSGDLSRRRVTFNDNVDVQNI